jgi:DNA-binding NarL/FixJ family response regulator
MSPIRLLIADDSVEFRKSVRAMLAFEKDVEVVAVARDGQEAVEMARHFQPDVAVMDVNMPRLDGLSAIRAIAQFSPATVCMVMSSEGEREMLRQAMAAGVREYLLKPFTPDDMVAAVRRVGEQAMEARQKAEAARSLEAEREKYLVQLTLAYLKIGRMDDDAAKVYAVMASRPQVDPNLLIRLAEVFLARRDWRLLRLVCERMEKRSGPLSK